MDDELPDKTVKFIYSGGPNDGKVRSSKDAPDGTMLDARGLWRFTHGGEIGAGFQGVGTERDVQRLLAAHDANDPSIAPHSHTYKVSDRTETDEEIVITLQHMPNETKAMRKPAS